MKNELSLRTEETLLQGQIVFQNGQVDFDETAKRIEYLIMSNLKKIKSDNSGWFILYLDEFDNRYWELSYPKSELQGGGAPKLENVDINDNIIINKYEL